MKTFVGLRFNHQFTKKNGCSALHLLIGIGTEFKKLPINLEWPPELVDEAQGRLLKRSKEDPDVNDFNLIIKTEMGKFNEIFKVFRLTDRVLTMEAAMQEFQNFDHKTDFLEYYEQKIKMRDRQGILTGGTPRTQRTALGSLKEFMNGQLLPVALLTPDFIRRYEVFLKGKKKPDGKKLSGNTIVRYLRTLKTYISLAMEDGIAHGNPFLQGRKSERVKLKESGGKVISLTPEEYQAIEKFYRTTPGLSIRQRVWLLRFLLACETDLRISDIKTIGDSPQLSQFFVAQGKIEIQPQKTKSVSKVWVSIPISRLAGEHILELARLTAIMKFNRKTASDQKGNKYLKVVATALGIDKNLHYHIGRHTFATNYLRAGGQVQNLQNLLGHSSISSTMKYVHVNEEDKKSEVDQLMNFMQNKMKPATPEKTVIL